MVRDPNCPKRPMSGYFRYANSVRDEVAEESGLTGIALTPLLSARWKDLTLLEKKEYNDTAAKEMDKYKKVYARYKETSWYKAHREATLKKKYNKKPKDLNKPKMPSTAFFMYANTIRNNVVDNNSDMTGAQIGKRLGEMWSSLTINEKSKFVVKASKAKELWKKKMEIYKETDNYKRHQKTISIFKKKRAEALGIEKPKQDINKKNLRKINESKKHISNKSKYLNLNKQDKSLKYITEKITTRRKK